MTLFAHETPWDPIAPRSLALRRGILVAVSLVTAAIIAAAAYPTNFTDFGLVATFRSILGLLGLALISRSFVPQNRMWVAPVVATVASMTFGWPWNAPTSHSVWGALRAPGTWRMHGGGWDVSLLVCAAVFVLGTVLYLRNSSFAFTTPATAHGTHHAVQRSPRKYLQHGLASASYRNILLVTSGLLTAVTMFSLVNSWGASPRMMSSDNFQAASSLITPVIALAGVMIGNTRHRIEVTAWERTSPRHTARIVLLIVRPFLRGVVIVFILSVLILGAASLFGALHGGMPISTGLKDLGSSAASLGLLLIVWILCGLIGLLVGWYVPTLWVAPAVFAVALAGCYFITTSLISPNTDRDQARAYGYTRCERFGPHGEVCAADSNIPYLQPAAKTLDTLVSSSAYAQELPTQVRLHNRGAALRETPEPRLSLTLEGQRRLLPPQRLDDTVVRTQLANSVAELCDSSLMGPLTTAFDTPAGTSTDPQISSSLARINQCFSAPARGETGRR
ncbi:hypothetical protein ACUY3K_05490 [Corynebacterium uberis]|uniref:hypothetical protein n=1 Tax=Corynebacterium TaxID=1716 RepID=UPI001D0B2C4A|nr:MULTISPECIES: hypothetical protein [Corynebacterium]MCZ9309274.1 hypothetical protein [Corynebacterium sp. c6VSa_13]UDL72829.1 hypothetical protein LH391_06815 [Corynebacterium uberis]UDL76293.1 hypothetical protein LH393_02580 [Corynebacterium uberis]UDL78506.1 hypothetical protein LH394_02570 [Corynebacterium uberis]UDL80787.1 hypothetical protein LH392_03000 [Corynebacterium uberis]